MAELLLTTEGVDLNMKDSRSGQTPLSHAAANGHEIVVKRLIAMEGVDVNTKDSRYGRIPLSYAAMNGHEAVVKLLLATEAVDVNTKDRKYGLTPLSYAAAKGHEDALLIEARADVNIKSDDGRTPLLWAAIKGRRRNVELLVEVDKVDLNIDTTLWSKTSSPDPEIMQIIQAAKEKRCSSSKVPAKELIRNEFLIEAAVASPPALPSQQNPASPSTIYLSRPADSRILNVNLNWFLGSASSQLRRSPTRLI
ncbi:ankyrin [Morchella conica CCBAS932]|uniref:Ankyrin n=1 Tax=Morchella conica CCBAS932 TaxID=1392247 RepID=A0A3N4L3B8_9PEZI|nr:ankyrin [Morchella conica CCBAS932]